MSIPNDPIVVEMPNAFVSPDGSFAEMEFKNSDGSSQILKFSPDTMMIFVSKIFELFLNQKIQMESMIGHVVVQPLRAVTTFAQPTIGGKAVILQFRLQSGLPVAFSVSPLEAEELHRQIGEAVKKIKRQSPENRH
jgi:hypothetical protein